MEQNMYSKKKIPTGFALQTLRPRIINNAEQKLIHRSLPMSTRELSKTKFTLKMLCKMNTKCVNNNKMLHYRIIAVSWQ